MKKKVSFEGLTGLVKNAAGLSKREAESQRLVYGYNEIIDVAGNPWAELAKETAKDPMLWLLIGIGSVFTLIGNYTEAATLFLAILPLTFMDVFLHHRSQASTESLRDQLAPTAKVIRENKELSVAATEITPGDLVVLNSGDYLPADGVFEKATNLQIDESILTGEAFAVSKQHIDIDVFALANKGEIAVNSEGLGYAGTRVLRGEGLLRIYSTGQRTQYGEIVQSISKAPQERTPLQLSVTQLVRTLAIAALGLCLLLAVVRLYQGKGWLDALLSAATLAVAAIPEEFPVVFTFFLGVGVFRLSKRHALVRRAVSVENIGRVTHICTDKTGTITIGELKLTHLDLSQGITEAEIISTALAASDSTGSDPVDLAIQDMAKSLDLQQQEKIKVFPFTESRKCEVAFAQDLNGKTKCFMKGAPETVLAASAMTDETRNEWLLKTSRWASEGHKVLACASRVLTSTELKDGSEPKTGLQFSGLLAFEDPPRAEVAEAVRQCKANRIGLLMVTGDHPQTALAIAKDIGIGGTHPLVASAEDEPDKFTKEALRADPEFLLKLNVAARCSPLQKLWIVEALKQAGELVAVTGDGINDVPALKAADIGIAMGRRGSRSAKEVSSIVLVDDNFSTLVNAIMEGRQLFRNLKTSFEYLLLIHIPLVLTAALIPLWGYPILYLPVHIVWLELIIHPTALFAFQQPAVMDLKQNMLEQRGRSRGTFFSRNELIWIILGSAAMSIGLAWSYLSGLQEGVGEDHARASVLVALSLWNAAVVLRTTRLNTWGC